MLTPEQIYQVAQALVDKLEKNIDEHQQRIQGIALLYQAIKDADSGQEASPEPGRAEDSISAGPTEEETAGNS